MIALAGRPSITLGWTLRPFARRLAVAAFATRSASVWAAARIRSIVSGEIAIGGPAAGPTASSAYGWTTLRTRISVPSGHDAERTRSIARSAGSDPSTASRIRMA